MDRISGLEVRIQNNNDIKNNSAGEVSIVESSNENKKGTFSSLEFGSDKSYKVCSTCGCSSMDGSKHECPGHFGHIRLNKPIYIFAFLQIATDILKTVCTNCSKLLIQKSDKFMSKLKHIIATTENQYRLRAIIQLQKSLKFCAECHMPRVKVKKLDKPKIGISIEYEQIIDKITNTKTTNKRSLPASEALAILSSISDTDIEILGFDPNKFSAEDLIGRFISVPPPHVRPTLQTQEGKTQDDDITHILAQLLRTTLKQTSIRNNQNDASAVNKNNSLQELITYYSATIFSNNTNLLQQATTRSGKKTVSVTQRFNTKDGLFRNNGQGKRVNSCGRSVITPNPLCHIREVTLPLITAMELTYPEIVTEMNVESLHKIVQNRAIKYPGANFVYFANRDETKDLRYAQGDIQLRPGDVVHRHLQDGDMIMFNRQPTLHKLGMLGMQVKVRRAVNSTQLSNVNNILTYSFPPPVCKPFNADYDGDEMNIHAPQSSSTVIELKYSASLPKQIISVAKCSPCISLYFDTLLGSYFLTDEIYKFNKSEILDLISNLDMDIDTLLPDGITEMTGKDIISKLLPIELCMKTSNIDIECGQFKSGILTKSNAGTYKKGNIFHNIWELNGPFVCCDSINNMTKLANQFVLQRGFTISLKDIMFNDIIRKKVKELSKDACDKVDMLFRSVENGEEQQEIVEHLINQELGVVREECTKFALQYLDKSNNLFCMIKGAGSRGSDINIGQLGCILGQQDYESGRIPTDYNRRSLPYYCQGDNSAKARGFITNSFLDGINPTEFFFHCMVGRVGLIDTAVKTALTGYLQRKLIKSLESIMYWADGTVRAANGDIIQYMYGESNSHPQHMYKNSLTLPFISYQDLKTEYCFSKSDLKKYSKENKSDKDAIKSPYPNAKNIIYDDKKYEARMIEYKKELMEWLCKNNYTTFSVPRSVYLNLNLRSIITKVNKCYSTYPRTKLTPSYVLMQLEMLLKDRMISKLFISEHDVETKSKRFQRNKISLWLLERILYMHISPKQCILKYKFSKNQFNILIRMIRSKLITGRIDYGTMVGIWAAQSIGEPLTQQTLNTFHTAGVGSTAVSNLGIPRLKELLHVSPNPKVPIMRVHIVPEHEHNFELIDNIAKNIQELYLADVYKNIEVIHDPEQNLTKEDKVYNSFQLFHYANKYVDAKNIDMLSFVIRIELDKEKLFKNKLSLWRIRLEFIHFWNHIIPSTSRISKKNIKKIRNFITGCALLSNSEIDDNPVIHIRLGLVTFDIDILETLCNVFLHFFKIRGLNGIKKTFVEKIVDRYVDENGILQEKNDDTNPRYMIFCHGINVTEIGTIRHIDMTRTVTNNLHTQYITNGIEGVRWLLLKELRLIQGFDDILFHHISILVDYMCHPGFMVQITRHGVNLLDRDLLARASFEQTTDIILKGAIWSQPDRMDTVSSNIFAGNLARIGTALPRVKINFDAINKIPLSFTSPFLDALDIFRNSLTEDILNKEPRNVFLPNM